MIDIKVLGPGCHNCQKLENLCHEVVQENGIEAKVEKLTTLDDFHKFGIMMTPALVVNGKVLSQGKIPVKATLASWLFTVMAEA
jgi:small redox-active disulfide protein 2